VALNSHNTKIELYHVILSTIRAELLICEFEVLTLVTFMCCFRHIDLIIMDTFYIIYRFFFLFQV